MYKTALLNLRTLMQNVLSAINLTLTNHSIPNVAGYANLPATIETICDQDFDITLIEDPGLVKPTIQLTDTFGVTTTYVWDTTSSSYIKEVTV